jgi:hypothetical protein
MMAVSSPPLNMPETPCKMVLVGEASLSFERFLFLTKFGTS